MRHHVALRNEPQQHLIEFVGIRSSPPTYKNKAGLHLVTLVIKKTVIPEVFYRESMLSNRFPIKDFGNDELLLLPYLQVTAVGLKMNPRHQKF
jgi:hypothetical protein